MGNKVLKENIKGYAIGPSSFYSKKLFCLKCDVCGTIFEIKGKALAPPMATFFQIFPEIMFKGYKFYI